MCSQSQAIGILGEVYTACGRIFGSALKEGYLYGSYARGDFHEESDVDILLTVDMEPEAISSLRSGIGLISSDLSLKHDVTVSVTVKPYIQFRRYADILPYYRNVLGEGIRYAS